MSLRGSAKVPLFRTCVMRIGGGNSHTCTFVSLHRAIVQSCYRVCSRPNSELCSVYVRSSNYCLGNTTRPCGYCFFSTLLLLLLALSRQSVPKYQLRACSGCCLLLLFYPRRSGAPFLPYLYLFYIAFRGSTQRSAERTS